MLLSVRRERLSVLTSAGLGQWQLQQWLLGPAADHCTMPWQRRVRATVASAIQDLRKGGRCNAGVGVTTVAAVSGQDLDGYRGHG